MTSEERSRGSPETRGHRLQALLGLLPRVEVVADIGCDHAALACAAVASGRARRAIGVDISASALAAGARTVAQQGLTRRVELRRGDGFAPILPVDGVEAAALAGVGGRTVLELCARCDPRSLGLRWLVIQPNRDAAEVRVRLSGAGWGLVDERLPEVRGRAFPTLRFDAQAPPLELTPLEALLGPHLLRARPPALTRLAARLHAHYARKPPGAIDREVLDALESLRSP